MSRKPYSSDIEGSPLASFVLRRAEELKLRPSDIQRKTGISLRHVIDVQRGTKGAGRGTLRKLARALEVPFSELRDLARQQRIERLRTRLQELEKAS